MCHKHKSPLKLKRQLILTEAMGECSNFSIRSDQSRSLSFRSAFFPVSYTELGRARERVRTSHWEEAKRRREIACEREEFLGKVVTKQNESSLIKSSMLHNLKHKCMQSSSFGCENQARGCGNGINERISPANEMIDTNHNVNIILSILNVARVRLNHIDGGVSKKRLSQRVRVKFY